MFRRTLWRELWIAAPVKEVPELCPAPGQGCFIGYQKLLRNLLVTIAVPRALVWMVSSSSSVAGGPWAWGMSLPRLVCLGRSGVVHVVFVVPPSSRWVVRVDLFVVSFYAVLVS